jgi:hypothetical protein
MTPDYWVGLATLPALAIAGTAVYITARTLTEWTRLIVNPTRDYGRSLSVRPCPKCGQPGPYVMWPPLTPKFVVAWLSGYLHRRECTREPA